MAKNTPEKIVEKLKDNLLKVDRNESNDLLNIERAIGICSSPLLEMREFVIQYNFKDKKRKSPFLNSLSLTCLVSTSFTLTSLK